MLDQAGIYAIVNIDTREMYVGSAVSLRRRWGDHRSNLRRDRHKSKALQSSWQRFGEAAFSFDILEFVSDKRSLLTPDQLARKVAAVTGKKRGPYQLDPTKATARSDCARHAAAVRWRVA